MGTGSISGVYIGWGVAFTTQFHVAPRLKKEYSYIPTPLWDFMTCSRIKFTSYLKCEKFIKT
jgi:hypothetical protein